MWLPNNKTKQSSLNHIKDTFSVVACVASSRTTSPELLPCTPALAAPAAWTPPGVTANRSLASLWLLRSLPTTGGQRLYWGFYWVKNNK